MNKIYKGSPRKIKEKSEEDCMDLIEKITLDAIFAGTKKTNFRILKMLPTNVEKVMKEMGLTKVPANNHINELEKYGLLERKRYTGKVFPTKLTKILLKYINKIGLECIEPRVDRMVRNLID